MGVIERVLLGSLVLAGCSGTTERVPPEIANTFFAMDTVLTPRIGRTTPEIALRIGWLEEAGFDGFAWRLEGLDAMLEESRRRGFPLVAVYANLSIAGTGTAAIEPLVAALDRLDGTGTTLWLTLRNDSVPRSSPEGDARAVELLRELDRHAGEAGCRIALYPHTGFWAERVGDVVRVADRVDRPGVGVTFNLCHWLKAEPGSDLGEVLDAALPRLVLVTVNGADGDGADWRSLIRPLDEGTFDVGVLLTELRCRGYSGPIGLQGYAIPGDPRANLERSARAWARHDAGATPPD